MYWMLLFEQISKYLVIDRTNCCALI